MPEPGDRLGLGPEPRRGGRPGVRPGQDHLQGAEPVQRELAGQVDDPHAAPAQLAEDLVSGRPHRLTHRRAEVRPGQLGPAPGRRGRLAGRRSGHPAPVNDGMRRAAMAVAREHRVDDVVWSGSSPGDRLGWGRSPRAEPVIQVDSQQLAEEPGLGKRRSVGEEWRQLRL